MMKTSMANGGGRDAADRALVGQIVMTMYNNRTYKVSSIAWDKTPTSTFPVRRQNAGCLLLSACLINFLFK